jgi:ABC-type multidrug transport system ATPase subunit
VSLQVENLRSALAGPFTFTVEPGTCLAITGPSGSGKTLLLRMLADLDPNEGTVSLDRIDRSTLPAPSWRRRVGLVPARCGWWDHRVDAHFEADVAGERFALAARLLLPEGVFGRGVAQASTGERQRLGLIRALLARPRVLLLDEPTGSLDPVATGAVERLLADQLIRGTSLLMVTHDAAQADRMGSKHLQMRDRVLVPA